MSNLTLAKLGPYQLLSLLGVGGMAEIYRAHDPRLDREVAIKVLPFDLARQPGFLERFRREARVVAMLDHPNIMPIYDFGDENGVLYVVMPLIEGGTLRDRIVKRGTCTLRETVSILYQVAMALHEAHQHGLVHRDVKPANILMAPGERAVLTDFGIVRALAEERAANITQEGMGVGTPEYMSPEQARGEKIDHRADVYALGIVLFQALTGRVPFTSTAPFETAYKQVHEEPPLPRSINPAIPPMVEAVILKALEKDPNQRYQSAAAFANALAESTPWLPLAIAQQTRRGPVSLGGNLWHAWGSSVSGEPLTEPGLGREAARRAGVYVTPSQSGLSGHTMVSRLWAVVFSLTLVVLLFGGAFAAVGALGVLNHPATPPPIGQQQPTPTSAPPSPTATTVTPPTAVYYLAQFFVLTQDDLLQGDQLGQTVNIENNQYQRFEGPNGSIYQSGDATQFGRAFGTGTVIRTQQGDLRFVVVADRFTTLDDAQQYYQHQVGLLSQVTGEQIGEQASVGLGRVQGRQASYRLVLLDRNVVVVFASPRMPNAQTLQNYFLQLAQVIDQRGHRCQFNADLQPVNGSPAMCTQN
jgi:serine/threonine protein kinase